MSIAHDVRYALRNLRRRPAFTCLAVFTFAIGIGAATAMFSVLDGVLLRDLPIREQDRVMGLWTEAPARGADRLPVPYADLVAFAERSRTAQALAGAMYQGAMEQVFVDDGEPLTLTGTWVTGNFFEVLGVEPAHGRSLSPADDVPGVAPAMVISDRLWRREFGAEPGVIGRRMMREGKAYTVVGVAPRGFEYPQGADFWVPVMPDFPRTLEPGASPAESLVLTLVARLAGESSPEALADEYAAFLRATDPDRNPALREMRPVVVPLTELITGGVRSTLWIITAAVALLLVIACANIANLLLVRGAARARELAVRSALGAGRRRLVRQLMTETGLLAVLGGAAGCLLAVAIVRGVVALAPPELPRADLLTVDPRILLFSVFVTAAAALLAGILPAIRGARRDPAHQLSGGIGTSNGRSEGRIRAGLVAGQVAIAVMVVVGAGLLVRSLVALQSADLGFEHDRLVLVQTALPSDAIGDRGRQVALHEQVLERLAALPEVVGAAAVPSRPFAGEGGWTAMYTGDGQDPHAQAANPWVSLEVVGPEYFATLGIPVRRGRPFTAADREDALPVAVISAEVARRTWPGEDPVGQRVKLGGPDSPAPWHTVVGVVGETRYRDLVDPQPSLYLPVRQFGGPVPMAIALRTTVGSEGLIPQVREVLREAHPDWLLVTGAEMREHLAEPLARPRFTTVLLGALATLTLVLAAVGIYGVLMAATRQRTREIGLRIALGASRGRVRGLVIGQGVRVTLLGCGIGIAGALGATRMLEGMLFGIPSHDPVTLGVVVALVMFVASIASWLPARRAARVDPMIALRAE